MSSATEGVRGEQAVARYLIRRGWRIVARRWRTGAGEIDLVARRGRLIAFVEVKTRARPDDGDDSISLEQRRRLHRAADVYLARQAGGRDVDVRHDLALVGPARPWRRIDYRPGELDVVPAPRRGSAHKADRAK